MHKPFLNILSTLVDILRHFILYVAGNEQCNDNFIIMYSILEFPAGDFLPSGRAETCMFYYLCYKCIVLLSVALI